MVGYKQTDIGLIPVDWEVKKLGAVTDVIGGGTPSTSIKEYWNGNINWFTPTEISEIKYSYSSKRKITSLGLNNSSARMLPIGTILLTSRAGIGDLSILGTESSTNQGFQSLVTKKEINNEFLYYLMKTKKNVLLEYASGSTFLEISPKNLKSIQIPLPPLPEQEAIAEVLSDTDELIGALEKRIAKKRLIKQGAMQTLLTPKDDWEVKKLGEIIHSFQNGYGFSAKGYVNVGTPIVTMAQIGLNGTFQYDKENVNKWQLSDFHRLKDFHLKNGDVIIAMTDVTPQKNLIGRMTIVKTSETLLLNQRVGLLRLDKKKINATILCTLSNMKKWRNYSIASASLGVQANIGTKDILNGVLILPPIQEQTRIATILSDMDNEINALEKKLSKTKELKQGLMQQLLTGKIRLV